MNLAKLVKASNARARQLLVRALREIWPKADRACTGKDIELFVKLAAFLPKVQDQKSGDVNGMNAMGASDAVQPGGPDMWRDLITQIYTEHNPSKLGDVDTLLTKYKGRERTLYLGICEKYKVAPALGAMGGPPGGMPGPPGMPPMPPPPPPPGSMAGMPPGRMPGMPATDPAADEERVKKFRELICEVYKEHNPS